MRHDALLDIKRSEYPDVSPAVWNLLTSLMRSLFVGLLGIMGKLKIEAPGAEQERSLFKEIPALFHRFILELAQWWWSNQDRGFLGTTLTCSECKKDCLAYKGDIGRKVVTLFGIISLRRAYYYCASCKRGLSPLDERLGLGDDCFLPAVREVVTWLTSMDPYGKCLEFIGKLLEFSVSPRSAWLITQRVAAEVKTRSDEELKKAFGEPAELYLPEPEVSPPEVGVVSMDGVMARIGKPGAKEHDQAQQCSPEESLGDLGSKPGFQEVKLAMAGHLMAAKQNPTKEKDKRPSLGLRKYAVHLGQPQALFQMLLLLIYRLGLHRAKTLLVIADGAHWIWNGVKEHFAALGVEIVEILDYWHAVEHLWALSRALYGHGTQEAWVAMQKRRLLHGRQGDFFAALESAVVQTGPMFRSASAWPASTTRTFGTYCPLLERNELTAAECQIRNLCGLLRGSWANKVRAHLKMKQARSKKGSKTEKNPTAHETAVETLTYFRNNHSRIRYHEYLSKGYLIGSGAMEGACKHLVKERAHRSGMRWGPEGCMSILRNRALIKSGDWDAFWTEEAHRRQSKYLQLKELLGAA